MKPIAKPIQLITKSNCDNCKVLRAWLIKEKIPYDELPIDQKKIQDELLMDPKFQLRFCEIDKCIPNIPAIRISRTGEYFFHGLDGVFNVYEMQKIIRDNYKK